MFTRRLLPAVLVTGALLLSACTGDDSDSAPADERLDAAIADYADAESLEISLTTAALPSGVKGLLSAKGVGNHSPAFDGDVEVVAGGASIGAEVIAVDGKVWAKTGFSPLWAPLDPASFGAPDPAALVGTDAESGVAGLLGVTEDLEVGDKSRDGDDVLTEITGKIPGAEIAELIPTAGKDTDFTVVYRLTDDNEMHDAKITGPFYGGDDVTYTLTIDADDDPVTIEAP